LFIETACAKNLWLITETSWTKYLCCLLIHSVQPVLLRSAHDLSA